MKTRLKSYFEILQSPKGQRWLIILLPCLTLVICALILLPGLLSLNVIEHKDDIPAPIPTGTQLALPSPEPSDVPEALMPLSVAVDAQGAELFVSVSHENGLPTDGYRFQINLLSPSGDELIYFTSQTGTCHIVELEPGEYSLEIPSQHGFAALTDIFTVGTSHEYQRIYDVTTMQSSPVEQSHIGWVSENGKTRFFDSSGWALKGFARIDGKLCYFDEDGCLAKALGIDVSYYNGNIDWAEVKSEGIDFVIIRTGGRGWSSGMIYEDSTAFNYLLDAKEAGLDVGLYFYSTAINVEEAEAEARAVLARLNNEALDYPIYVDMEYSGQYPGGRADTLSKAERMKIANAFFRTVEACGYEAGLYSSQYYLNTAIDHRSLAEHSIWIANYIEGLTRPNFYGKYDIWQFTDRAKISGIIGPVDMNIQF